MGPLESSWAKFRRGMKHLEELDREQIDWCDMHGETPPFTLETYADPYVRQNFIRVASVREMDTRFGVIIGDVLTNFRACFDHAAWELVQRYGTRTLTEKEEGQIYWPIYDWPERFRKALDKKLPGLPDFYRALVEGHQPYAKPAARLNRLRDLTDLDKHRYVHTTLVKVEGEKVRLEDVSGGGFDLLIPVSDKSVPIQKGTKLARISHARAISSQAKMGMTFHVKVEVALEDGTPVSALLGNIGAAALEMLADLGPWLIE